MWKVYKIIKTVKPSYILNKSLFLFPSCENGCGNNDKIIKKRESIETRKILGLIDNIYMNTYII